MLTDQQRAFLEQQHSAAMITPGGDGMPKAARVGVAMVDGQLWSSGTQVRTRTRRLRRDPRCTLFVFDQAASWLGLETTVTILDGSDAPALNVRLFRQMQGQPTGPIAWFGQSHEEEQFLRMMADEGRLIYEFQIEKAYGLLA